MEVMCPDRCRGPQAPLWFNWHSVSSEEPSFAGSLQETPLLYQARDFYPPLREVDESSGEMFSINMRT